MAFKDWFDYRSEGDRLNAWQNNKGNEMNEENKTVEITAATHKPVEVKPVKALLPWELENPVPEQEDKKEHKL